MVECLSDFFFDGWVGTPYHRLINNYLIPQRHRGCGEGGGGGGKRRRRRRLGFCFFVSLVS